MKPEDIINQTNAYRKSQGLKPLTANPQLTKAAQSAGEDMNAKGYFSHVTPDGKSPWSWIDQTGYSYTYAGQNLARDFADATSTMDAWKKSPTHNKNLVNPNYTEIGVAVVNGKVVQVFASPSQASSKETGIPEKNKTPTQANPPVPSKSPLPAFQAPDPALDVRMSATTPQRI